MFKYRFVFEKNLFQVEYRIKTIRTNSFKIVFKCIYDKYIRNYYYFYTWRFGMIKIWPQRFQEKNYFYIYVLLISKKYKTLHIFYIV